MLDNRPLPNSNGRYTVSCEGVVMENDKVVPEVEHLDRRGVWIDWYRGKAFYEKHFLFIVAFYAKYLPVSEYENIEIVFSADGEKVSFDYDVFYRFKNGPLETKQLKGFYHIPYLTRYAVNREGQIFDLLNLRLVAQQVARPQKEDKKNRTLGYNVCRIDSDLRGISGTSRHRVLGLTFLKYPSNPLKLVMNHLNGVPGDDRIENLEWTTRAANNQHAIDSGLTPNSVVNLDVKNVFTKEELSFMSVAAAARHLGLSEAIIRLRLGRQSGFIYEDGWLFKRKNDEWVKVDPRIKARNDAGSFHVLARDVFANTIYLFESIELASEGTGVYIGGIRKRCRTEECRPFNGFVFRYRTQQVVWPEYSSLDLAVYKEFPQSGGLGVFVIDSEGNERFFASATLAGAAYGYSRIHFDKAIRGERNIAGLRIRPHTPSY